MKWNQRIKRMWNVCHYFYMFISNGLSTEEIMAIAEDLFLFFNIFFLFLDDKKKNKIKSLQNTDERISLVK